LNAGAEISLEYVPEKRGVKLLRGEALFEVFKNPLRPFIVIADQIEVRAVGTAFTVRQAADAITVLVTEGKVSIDCTGPVTGEAPPRHFSVPIQVAAGCATTIPRSPSAGPPTTKAVSPDEINAALAWRDRCIEFTGTPLAETLEHFNRRTERQLVIGDELTGALRITGIVWTDDPDGFARLLESSLGVKADYSVRGKIILRQP
jgi:transmembrane sensor